MTTSAIARAVALIALCGVALWTMFLARDALLIVYISGVLALGLGPIVHWLENAVPKGLPRWVAILIIYVAIVGLLTILGLMIVQPLMQQSQELRQRLPELINDVQDFLIRYEILDRPITLEEAVRNAPGPGTAVGTVATAVTRILSGAIEFVTILILTFYLLLESESIFEGFIRLFPRDDRPRVESVSREISTKMCAWLSGQFILAGTIGLTAAIGLYLIGVPYFYVLGFIAAIGEMIPVVGPIASAVPLTGVALVISPRAAIITVLFLFVQQQLENHILVPKIMSHQVGVSAVTVITALLIGGTLLGIPGALLAVPTAAIIQVVVQELLNERDRPDDLRLH
ncbi:MAG: AI-2E family transporter [Acidobacteriaceae bacterium]|nr:AI-2E family transporter [Acidobacteriaceae bacterium]